MDPIQHKEKLCLPWFDEVSAQSEVTAGAVGSVAMKSSISRKRFLQSGRCLGMVLKEKDE